MFAKLRAVFFWVHLSLGVTTALVALILCVTGALLAVELPVTRWADQRHILPPTTTSGPPSVEQLAAALQTAEAKRPERLTIGRDPRDPAIVSFGRREQVFYDPWQRKALGADPGGLRGAFRGVMTFHRWFALSGSARDVGRLIVGVSTLGFVVLTITGVVLWLPRRWRWQQVRAVLWFRRGLTGKARDFNWHHVLGIWFVLPLLFFGMTGAGIAFKPVNAGLVWLAGGTPQPRDAQPGPPRGEEHGERGGRGAGDQSARAKTPNTPLPELLTGADAALAFVATAHPDWQRLSVAIPKSADAPLQITADSGNSRQAQHQVTLTIARPTPKLLSSAGWADTPRERQAKTVIRFGHTGELFGPLGQLLAALACLAGAVLSITGALLSWRRFGAWRKRRARQAPSAPTGHLPH